MLEIPKPDGYTNEHEVNPAALLSADDAAYLESVAPEVAQRFTELFGQEMRKATQPGSLAVDSATTADRNTDPFAAPSRIPKTARPKTLMMIRVPTTGELVNIEELRKRQLFQPLSERHNDAPAITAAPTTRPTRPERPAIRAVTEKEPSTSPNPKPLVPTRRPRPRPSQATLSENTVRLAPSPQRPARAKHTDLEIGGIRLDRRVSIGLLALTTGAGTAAFMTSMVALGETAHAHAQTTDKVDAPLIHPAKQVEHEIPQSPQGPTKPISAPVPVRTSEPQLQVLDRVRCQAYGAFFGGDTEFGCPVPGNPAGLDAYTVQDKGYPSLGLEIGDSHDWFTMVSGVPKLVGDKTFIVEETYKTVDDQANLTSVTLIIEKLG